VSRKIPEDERPDVSVGCPVVSTMAENDDVAVANVIHGDRSPLGRIDKWCREIR